MRTQYSISLLVVAASALAVACGDGGSTGGGGSGAGAGAPVGGGGAETDGGGPDVGGQGAGQGGGECIPTARDCTSAADNDCSGMPDNTECTGCARSDGTEAVADDTEACFTFPSPATPTGVCAAGEKTCVATADKTALEWGPCEGETGPTSETDSCDPAANGDENCDGDARDGCPCQPGDPPMACGSCGGTQECGADFQWGPCSAPTPGNLGTACDAGCGTIQCSGQCSTSGHGGSCGSCGGTVQCNGSCSVGTPGNFGQACDAGCGTIQCSGQCSTTGHGGSCGSCGGTVLCNGSCSVPTPGNFGQGCDAGCGSIQCNGQCSTSGHGGACNQCGSGTVQCNGACSSLCDVNTAGTSAAVGWGWCAPQKTGSTPAVSCPSGTQPVYCGMGWNAGFWGNVYDEGDGTSRIYNGQGDIDARWDGNSCYLYIRAFNCDATTAHPVITCRG